MILQDIYCLDAPPNTENLYITLANITERKNKVVFYSFNFYILLQLINNSIS